MQMNCSARHFVDGALNSVSHALRLAGVSGGIQTSLSYHFDPGHSHGKRPPQSLTGQAAAARAAAEELVEEVGPEATPENCSGAELQACGTAVSGLASLDGLIEYLADALESGVASPTPERLARLGWAPAAQALLGNAPLGATGSVELGGGSGAGFQIVCGEKALATLGGGGGGGLFGHMRTPKTSPSPQRGVRPPVANETVGGGAGGGMQIFFPANRSSTPWEAEHWISWGSGGGYGCGTCKPGDSACEAMPLAVTCGAKMDDKGAVRQDLGQHAVKSWRVGVLRHCFDTGRLAVIGGGGGGAGSALCCAEIPRLKYGFGFRAELRPAPSHGHISEHLKDECCPDLLRWNASAAPDAAFGSELAAAWPGRRMSQGQVAFGGLGGKPLPEAMAGLVDPFARERTGHQAPNHGNRRPSLGELMRQHDQRLGVDRKALRAAAQSCDLPTWLNGTQLAALGTNTSRKSGDGSGTKEPEVALKYIFKFNPLQGYLAEGAGRCGGWSDWCCVCHTAQWRIACLPRTAKGAVDWFLTEDCCESKMKRDTSSPGFVTEATPSRSEDVIWRPGVGWIEVPRSMGSSDSYAWVGDFGIPPSCPKEDISDWRSVGGRLGEHGTNSLQSLISMSSGQHIPDELVGESGNVQVQLRPLQSKMMHSLDLQQMVVALCILLTVLSCLFKVSGRRQGLQRESCQADPARKDSETCTAGYTELVEVSPVPN